MNCNPSDSEVQIDSLFHKIVSTTYLGWFNYIMKDFNRLQI